MKNNAAKTTPAQNHAVRSATHARLGCLVAATIFASLLTPGAVLAHGEPDCQAVMDQHSKSIVTIKLFLTIKGGFAGPDGQKIESETNGIMIDQTGVVLASSTELGGLPPALKSLMSRTGEMSVTPSDIKVLVGDDPDGLEAEIIARDSDLDLAWVRIKDPGDKPFPAMSLENNAPARPGQRLLGLMRMDKYFDRAFVIERFRVAGVTEKPRRLYVPDTQLGTGFCTPVFTEDSKLVGVSVLQLPELDVSQDNPFAAMSQMADIELISGGFILPAEVILKATQRVLMTESEPAETPEKKE